MSWKIEFCPFPIRSRILVCDKNEKYLQTLHLLLREVITKESYIETFDWEFVLKCPERLNSALFHAVRGHIIVYVQYVTKMRSIYRL
jgi:hypothetical protein